MGLFNNIVIKNIRFRSKCCTRNDDDTPSIPSTPKEPNYIAYFIDLLTRLEDRIILIEKKINSNTII